MKKTMLALILSVMFILTSVAAFAADSEGTPERIGVILYMLDEEDKPLSNTTILMQEDLSAEDAYEGETDKQGILMIPSFPLTGFIMAVRDKDNALSGLVDVTLYPGSETKIMNNPRSDNDRITKKELEESTLGSHINGSAPLEIAGGADSIAMFRYEVQVNQAAGGLGSLWKLAKGNELQLAGVSDGQPGGVIPEPTLPPDDENRPSDAPSPTEEPSSSPTSEPTASSGEQTPSASASSGEQTPSPSPTAPEQSPSPTATSGSVSPSPQPSPTAATASPEVSPTPTPVPASPSPTAAPTTQENLINMKLFLKGAENQALAYYKTVLNGSVEATTNGEGEAYYTNVTTNVTHQLAVYDPDGKEVGTCGIQFVPGNSTSLASVNTGGTYRIEYQQGSQDVYVELVVNGDAAAIQSASQAPIASAATPAPSQTTSPTARPTEDIIGTPQTNNTTPSGPSLRGYFSNDAGTAIPGVTIRLRNEDTKALSSAITTNDGTFVISQMPPGNYSLGAISPQGVNLGTVDFTAARGRKTQLKEGSDGKLYLSEAPDSDTVYMDVRELSNGTLGVLYAAQTPMLAPAQAATPEALVSVDAQIPNIAEEIDTTIVEDPEIDRSGQNAVLITIIAIACGGGLAAGIYLLTRKTRIK